MSFVTVVDAPVPLERGERRFRAAGRFTAGRTTYAIAAATALGLSLRVYLITRHGLLTSSTIEYDDGVYLGATLRLLQGAMPYQGFAFVQPPGILILSVPAALTAHLGSAATGLLVARLLTMCASATCIPLAGRLVRHRGPLVTLVTCGFLAVYPSDILASRTLLLEPWMDLCCLLGANAAFRAGRLRSPRQLAWAGVAFGFATAVKYWAGIPAIMLAALCLLERDRRVPRVRSYAIGLILGFAVPVAPFAAASPSGFVRDTVLDQIARAGTDVPVRMRLAYLTGLIDIMNRHGTITIHAVSHSLFTRAITGTTSSAAGGWLPLAVTVLGILVFGFAYFRRPTQRSPLEWFALATTIASAAAILTYSAFFYHYPAFTGPWLAIACGGAASALPANAALIRRAAVGIVACVLAVVTAVQVVDIAQSHVSSNPPATALIPAGACVVTDQVSLTVAADRFTASRPGCPDVVDSLATTLSLGHGTSVQGGADRLTPVVAAWRAILGHADYVWLTVGYTRRIPWPAGLRNWFDSRFRLVRVFANYGGSALYVQRSPR